MNEYEHPHCRLSIDELIMRRGNTMNEYEHPHCRVSIDELRHDEEQRELEKNILPESTERKLREAVYKHIKEMTDLDDVFASGSDMTLQEEVAMINAYHERNYADIGLTHFHVLTKLLRSRLEPEVMRQIADERDLP